MTMKSRELCVQPLPVTNIRKLLYWCQFCQSRGNSHRGNEKALTGRSSYTGDRNKQETSRAPLQLTASLTSHKLGIWGSITGWNKNKDKCIRFLNIPWLHQLHLISCTTRNRCKGMHYYYQRKLWSQNPFQHRAEHLISGTFLHTTVAWGASPWAVRADADCFWRASWPSSMTGDALKPQVKIIT